MGRICSWCGKNFEGRYWKDGPNAYCSAECISAGLFYPFLFMAVLLSILLAISILSPWLFSLVASHFNYNGFIVYGFYAVIAIFDVVAFYQVNKGWIARSTILRVEKESF